MATAILVTIAFMLGFEIRDRIRQKIHRDSEKQFWENLKKATEGMSKENEERRKRLNELINN
ncbi:hypothetical protein psyc5s11_29240 [Clostridium gelidum]|uniref:Phage protein n=1 Tax=Clostridium gelidum TaxID=704125 RepID=A0ABM7T5E3_9CLOT|nr:hypothetical protein [Clostridium gelidum]BCZ46857.1 hypothetical protein psyc5s11_29240 [Clostridium gelidum]